MLGFSTWAVLAHHLTSRHLIPAFLVPALYTLAMAAAAPLLSFSTNTALLIAGAAVWGAGMGIHDSTLRAAVADLVPPDRRGGGYGTTFTAVYGRAWLAGATIIGLLYEHGPYLVVKFVGADQLCALGATHPPTAPPHTRRVRLLQDIKPFPQEGPSPG